MTERNLTGFPSIDRPWLKYYSEEALNAPLPEGSMYDYMTACNAGRMDETALNYFGRKITHRQLQTEIDRCARALIASGVKAGDVVSLCMLAMPEMIYLLYAINKIGAIANFLVMSATQQELRGQLAVTGSKLVIALDMAMPQIKEAAGDSNRVISVSLAQSMPLPAAIVYRLKAKQSRAEAVAWREFLASGDQVSLPSCVTGKETPAVIEYTGGTTGKAKGVLVSNGAANAIAFQYRVSNNILDFEPGQRFLNILPPFLAYGIFLGGAHGVVYRTGGSALPRSYPRAFPGAVYALPSQSFQRRAAAY